MVWHWVYCWSSYAYRISVVKLVVLWYWDVAWAVQPVLSVTEFFISGARIDQVPLSSNYWKYWVGSGIIATFCGWSALFAHY